MSTVPEWSSYHADELLGNFFDTIVDLTMYQRFSFTTPDNSIDPIQENHNKLGVIGTYYIHGKPKFSEIPNTQRIDLSKKTVSISADRGKLDINWQIYLFISKNGDKLRQAYRKLIVRPTEIVFLLEDNDGDNFSSATRLCKIGSNWKKHLSQHKVLDNESMFTKYLNDFYQIDASDVSELLKNGEVRIKDVYDLAGKILFFTTAIPNYIISRGIVGLSGIIIDGLTAIKYKEEDWLPPIDKEVKFSPVFFALKSAKNNNTIPSNKQIASALANPGTNIALLTVSIISDALKKAENDCISTLQIIEKLVNDNKKSIDDDSNFVKDFFVNVIKNISSFFRKGLELIKAMHEQIEKFVDLNVNVLNAFLCGLVNGFIDGVNGLLTLIKWIFDANVEINEILKDIKRKLPPALEVIDQFLQALGNFNFSDIFTAVKDEIVHFLKTLSSELVSGEIERTMCILSYTAGNIVGMIIEFIAELVLTGGTAAVTKFFQSIANAGTKIVEIITKLAKAIFNITLEGIAIDMVNGLRILYRFLNAGKEKFKEFIKRFFAEVKAVLGLGLRPATEEFFEKMGIKWGKIYSTSGRLGMGGSGLREFKYYIEHRGQKIIRETKEEIEAIAKDLEKMSKEEAEKYLDDLVKSTLKLSEEAGLLLKDYADKALSFVKNERPGAVTVLEREGKRIFSYSNKTGLAVGELPNHFHMLVLDWLENTNKYIENGLDLMKRGTHGKCGEPETISKWLYELEKELGKKPGTLTLEEARKEFEGVLSTSIEINKKIPANHGIYKEACQSCNPLLKHFNITEIKL